MNVNSYVIEDYENETDFRLKKTNPNKAKTNPISNPVLSAACPERSRMGRMGQFLQRPKSLAKKSGLLLQGKNKI